MTWAWNDEVTSCKSLECRVCVCVCVCEPYAFVLVNKREKDIACRHATFNHMLALAWLVIIHLFLCIPFRARARSMTLTPAEPNKDELPVVFDLKFLCNELNEFGLLCAGSGAIYSSVAYFLWGRNGNICIRPFICVKMESVSVCFLCGTVSFILTC